MTNYTRGRTTEYKAVNELKKLGYQATRTAGSHSPFDVIAWNNQEIRFIQLKRTKTHPTKQLIENAKKKMSLPNLPCVFRELWIWKDHEGWITKKHFRREKQ